MYRTLKDLVALSDEGNMDNNIIAETTKTGIPALLTSIWEGFQAVVDPAGARAVYSDVLRIFSLLYDNYSPVVASIRSGVESENFDAMFQEVIDRGLLTGNHPAKIIPVMYKDANNVEAFMGLLNSVAEIGVTEPLSVDAEGLILNGHNRLQAAVMACRLDFSTQLEDNWSVAKKWGTIMSRDLTPSQRIAIAYSMHFRAQYKEKSDAANAIGVSVRQITAFDKALDVITADSRLLNGDLIDLMKHGHLTIADYSRVAGASLAAKRAREILGKKKIEFEARSVVPASDAGNAEAYFLSLETSLTLLKSVDIQGLIDADFPKALIPKGLLPAEEAKADTKKEDVTSYWYDGKGPAALLACGDVSIIIASDHPDSVAHITAQLASAVEGVVITEDVTTANIKAWQ